MYHPCMSFVHSCVLLLVVFLALCIFMIGGVVYVYICYFIVAWVRLCFLFVCSFVYICVLLVVLCYVFLFFCC